MSIPAHDDLLLFTPVPAQRVTANGWSAEVQRAFVAQLARSGVVSVAARSVGRSPRSAWLLRKRPGAESFAEAWEIAVDMAHDRAMEIAVARLDDPVQVPVFYRGRQVGVRTRFDNRLLHAAIRANDRLAERVSAQQRVAWLYEQAGIAERELKEDCAGAQRNC